VKFLGFILLATNLFIDNNLFKVYSYIFLKELWIFEDKGGGEESQKLATLKEGQGWNCGSWIRVGRGTRGTEVACANVANLVFGVKHHLKRKEKKKKKKEKKKEG